MRVCHLFISPGHRYFGRHGMAAANHPVVEVPEVECVAGRGLRGDRFFDFKPGYKGQITFIALEVLRDLWGALGVPEKNRDPSAPRRNVVVEGLDLNALVGEEFSMQGIRFLGTQESKPCHWMEKAIAPGAEAWLAGRGGLRAKILTTGLLRSGTAG